MSTGLRVLVVGASGALGSRIFQELHTLGGVTAVDASRSATSPECKVADISSRDSVSAALTGMDAAVVAAPQVHPIVQQLCAERGIPCCDVTASAALFQQAREQLPADAAASVMMCGLLPGLSGILAAHTAAELDEVRIMRIGFAQNTNANVGVTGTKDMLGMISRPVNLSGRETPGFTARRSMQIGGRDVTLRVINHDEAQVVGTHFADTVIEYCTTWQRGFTDSVLAGLSRAGVLARLSASRLPLRPRHQPTKSETVWLSAEAHGTLNGQPIRRRTTVEALSDYRATAQVTAEVLRHILTSPSPPTGVLTPMDFLTLENLDTLFTTDQMRLVPELA